MKNEGLTLPYLPYRFARSSKTVRDVLWNVVFGKGG